MKRLTTYLVLVMVAFHLCGCASGHTVITSPPSESYQKLGHVEGRSCGVLGIVSSMLYFIPMGLNGRYERAYGEALSKAPGATGLIDVTLSEDWFWMIIGTARCVTVAGEAVK